MRLEFGGIWIITFESFKDILVNLEIFIVCNYVYNNSCVCVCVGGGGGVALRKIYLLDI